MKNNILSFLSVPFARAIRKELGSMAIVAALFAGVSSNAFAQDKLTVSAAFQFPSTLNATIGYERPLSYGHAVELYGEAGTHWQADDFWMRGYWDGGIVYKHRLVRFKNGMLRFRFGPQFGAVRQDFFLGLEGSFEYSHALPGGWEFFVTQKNNVGFLHGDTFRNGLAVGLKIPL